MYSADGLFIRLAMTNAVLCFLRRELMFVTVVSLQLQQGFSSPSLEVALNETEVISGLLAQIKLPAGFCFL